MGSVVGVGSKVVEGKEGYCKVIVYGVFGFCRTVFPGTGCKYSLL